MLLTLCIHVLFFFSFAHGEDNCSFVTGLFDACVENVTNTTALYHELLASYSACGCGVNACALEVPVDYNLDLHVGAVFIILFSSALGVAFPLAAKHIKKLSIHPFLVVIGKCAGTGVLLAVSLVHMLLPANESLTSQCAPTAFNSDYGAYAYMLAMISAILMHFIDFILAQYFAARQEALNISKSAASDSSDIQPQTSHSHSHGSLLELEGQAWTGKAIAEAYMIEFGVTVHSIFIGIAVGVVGFESFIPLLIALVFHQFFEGIALGSRIVDAEFSRVNEFFLSAIFTISAPSGIAIGIGVYASLNTNGQEYLLVQGIFDAICAGILLYTGFMLLLLDFPRDMIRYCTGKYKRWMQFGMFASFWIAAGIMAFLGKYL